jgi:hypothetical protein
VRATLALSREGRAPGLEKRLPEFTTALTQRLEADQDIAGVTFADRFPGQEGYARLELENDGGAAAAATASEDALVPARTNAVAVNLFDLFEVPVVAGRGFSGSDVRPDPSAVIIDGTFAQRIGGNVVGKRVRYARSPDGETPPSPWFEIVGVVPAFADNFTTSEGP